MGSQHEDDRHTVSYLLRLLPCAKEHQASLVRRAWNARNRLIEAGEEYRPFNRSDKTAVRNSWAIHRLADDLREQADRLWHSGDAA